MTLHLKPERSLDSIFKVIEDEKAPKNDINFLRNEDGTYIINLPASDGQGFLLFTYRSIKLSAEERKKIKLKFIPIGPSPEIDEIRVLNKEHESPQMSYATIIYKNGMKKEVEIRDAN